MPVLDKTRHRQLMQELRGRYSALIDSLEPRDLNRPGEGLKRECWVSPELKCATKGSTAEIRLRLADFQAILNELKLLK